MDTATGIPGAQTLRRGLAILRLLAEHHEEGLRISDIATRAGLERATAHRLLSSLVEENFAERDAASKHYRLGMESMRLGLASLKRAPLIDAYRPVMQKIARLSGDTTFLLVRQGDWSVCLHREEGPFPVRVFTTEVGSVRPLGVGAAGLALLAAQPDEVVDAHIERHAAALNKYGRDGTRLRQAVARTRRLGYSEIVSELTEGVCGIGAIIPNAKGVFAAVSIGAIQSRLGPARRAELGPQLRDALVDAAGRATLESARP